MHNYALGEVAFIRFCALTQPLTVAQRAAFDADGSLPPGIGYDAPATFMEIQNPNEETAGRFSLDNGDFTEQVRGSYFAQIPMLVTGEGWWRAYGQDEDGNPQWSTKRQLFLVGT